MRGIAHRIVQVRELRHGFTLYRRDSNLCGKFQSKRLGFLRRCSAADLGKRRAIQPDRHDLRGDGESTFGLPDLRGRVPIHMGTSLGTTYIIGENGGVESVTLSTQQLPIHNHPPIATNTGQQLNPTNTTSLASPTSTQAGTAIFGPGPANTSLSTASTTVTGRSEEHTSELQVTPISRMPSSA